MIANSWFVQRRGRRILIPLISVRIRGQERALGGTSRRTGSRVQRETVRVQLPQSARHAQVDGTVDTVASEAAARKGVRVRFSPCAPTLTRSSWSATTIATSRSGARRASGASGSGRRTTRAAVRQVARRVPSVSFYEAAGRFAEVDARSKRSEVVSIHSALRRRSV